VSVTEHLLIVELATGSFTKVSRAFICNLSDILAIWDIHGPAEKDYRIGVLTPGGICWHFNVQAISDLKALLEQQLSKRKSIQADDGFIAAIRVAEEQAQAEAAAHAAAVADQQKHRKS
jgi:hypothetical protein